MKQQQVRTRPTKTPREDVDTRTPSGKELKF